MQINEKPVLNYFLTFICCVAEGMKCVRLFICRNYVLSNGYLGIMF